MKSLFEGVGKRLMVLAQVFFVLGILGTVFFAFNISKSPWTDEIDFGKLILITVIGFFVSYLTSLGMYGWGELLENVNIIRINFFRKNTLESYESDGLMEMIASIKRDSAATASKLDDLTSKDEK